MLWAVVVAQAVAHWTMDREVRGLNPAGSWAFFSSLLYPIFQSVVCPKSGHGGATLVVFNFPINS